MIRATELENLGRNAASFWWLMGIGRMAAMASGSRGGSILVDQASRACQRRKPDALRASTIREPHQLQRLCCQFRSTARRLAIPIAMGVDLGAVSTALDPNGLIHSTRHAAILLPLVQGCCRAARRGGNPLCSFRGIRSLRAAYKKPTEH